MVGGCCLGLLFGWMGWPKVAWGDYFTVSLVDSGYTISFVFGLWCLLFLNITYDFGFS